MFRFTKLALAAAALTVIGLAAGSASAAPVVHLTSASFNTAAAATTTNGFEGETVSSPVNYQASLTSMGVTFSGTNGTVGILNGSTFGTTSGNVLFLNGSGGIASSSMLNITPLANTTAFAFGIAPSSDVTLAPGATTTGQYRVTVTTSTGASEEVVVNSNVYGSFSFIGFTTSNGEYITSITVSTLAGGTPVIDNVQFNGTSAEPVPEPTTMLLFGTGIAGLASAARRRRNSAKTMDGEESAA
jgi:hypothetical protein